MTHPIPHGYKLSLLGLIPQDWEIIELEKIGKFLKGKGIPRDQIRNEGYPCIRYGELYTIYNYIAKTLVSFIDDEGAKESQEIKKGDILFAGSGETIEDIGKSIAYIGDNKAFAGGDIIILSVNNNIANSECLSYLLETDTSKKQKRMFGQGNSVVHIYSSNLSKLRLPLPPLPEQQAIASILSTCDESITTTQTLINRLQRRHKALCQQLLICKKRLEGFSEKRETVELGDVLDYIQPTKYIVRSTEYDKKYSTPVLTAGKTFILGYTNEKDGVFAQNLPVIIFDDFTTSTQFVNFPFKVKSSAMKILIKKNQQHNMTYIYAAMQQLKYIVGGHERHRISKYTYLTISIPSPEEQNAIASILDESQTQIDLAQAKLIKLKQQKQGLMQQLLTGKTRVPSNYL